MEKEKDRVEIKLNSPNNSYFTGQEISGQICFFLTKKTKIRAINLQVIAKGKCKWMEMYHKDIYGNVNSRQLFYTGKQIYLNDTVNVPYVPARGIELAPGELSMDFTYLLSQDLPSSFKGSYGSIKYKLKVVIQKPWTFDEKYTIPLTIVRNVAVSILDEIYEDITYRFRPDICQTTTRNVSIFGSGPISLIAKIPRNNVIRNEKLNLHVTVDNRSSIHVDKLRFTMVQKVSYHSMKPMFHIKTEEVTIFTKETGGVEKKTERSFAHDLSIPSCPPTHNANIINIAYVLNVEAILPAFYKNLSVSFKITVYSRNRDAAIGNPLEEGDVPLGVGIFPVNNRISSFISTNSPTHSQSLNESESSSLYSTTSESSVTTLSPATRPSIDCENLSRESMRNICRRSMGYIHPSTTASRQSRDLPPEAYPMLAESVHESYDPPAMNSSYPPPNTPALPLYLQSSVNFQVQARYPVNELPPSYDELFPRARSKSPTAPSPETPV
ncbi:arrestin domain-containing protein 17 [Episyrphus balteatus]|uniref:arrestin domain-containing protein 17 n=1 Tax=Episyrphus balteatus TaxID=286459 RepID=UPI0024862784|nr:arrestin domain-containing protein 17 [Episyrphus balteatus]